ncbi:hypothetical protein CTI12_AA427200 [Artemisia annua]|uniref:Uncharacterized protein n=2 Tax=Artemisia annua TaxID=35608 RepID=A0A2U1M2J1_ARTAN|nr:hypothetical protein CTI12_AA427200 [Artemisia annua]
MECKSSKRITGPQYFNLICWLTCIVVKFVCPLSLQDNHVAKNEYIRFPSRYPFDSCYLTSGSLQELHNRIANNKTVFGVKFLDAYANGNSEEHVIFGFYLNDMRIVIKILLLLIVKANELKSTIEKGTQEIDTMKEEVQAPGPVYNFSELSRSLRNNIRPAEREKVEADFKQEIGNLISEIDRFIPNLKALDYYDAL